MSASTLIWPPTSFSANATSLTLRRTDILEGDIVHHIVDRKPWRNSNSSSKTYRATLCRDGFPDRDVICKMVVGKKNVLGLRSEAKYYRNELKEMQNDIIPICFGLFEVEPDDDDLTACLVVSYCGEPLQVPLFGQTWEFKHKVISLLVVIHEAGVLHGDFGDRHIVTDEDGEPWIIDFDNAEPHVCKQKMPVKFHAQEPDMDEFGCQEIWETCVRMGTWTPRKIRFLKCYYPIECASSVEELAKCAPESVPKDKALKEAAYSIAKHQQYLWRRSQCEWKRS